MWEKEVTPWHRDEVDEALKCNLEFMVKFLMHNMNYVKTEEITFFAPLCGKSVDLRYLYEQGFRVIGCDCVELACQQFFTENQIPFTRKRLSDDFVHFEVRVIKKM